jgi:hypothetical protein
MNENFGKLKVPEDDEYKAHCEQEYGWEFEGPFYTQVPSPKQEYVGEHLQRLLHLREELLTTVIIHDQFDKDHWTRREFHMKEGSELIQFCKKFCKLRRGKMVLASGIFNFLLETLAQQNHELHGKIAKIFIPEEHLQALEQYNHMETEQKIKYARQMDDVIYRCLEALSQ